jgi:endothelin-converting enzyme/putative endopeptidase
MKVMGFIPDTLRTLSIASVCFLLGCEVLWAQNGPLRSFSGATNAGFSGKAATDDPPSALSGIDKEGFDPSVKFGDDFFLSVNGKWLKETNIPDDRADYGTFSLLNDRTQEQIKAIIEGAAEAKADANTPAQQVGDLYSSLMNTELRNQLGIKPIEDLISKVNQLESKEQLGALCGELGRYGIPHVIGYGVEPDARDSESYVIYVGQSGITLPDRDYYLVDEPQYREVREKFQKYIAAMLTQVGYADPSGAAERILALETAIAKAQWTNVENRDPIKTYNKMTAEDLSKKLANLAWPQLAKAAGFEGQADFVVQQPSFLETIDQLVSDTDLKIWKEFLLFHTIDNSAGLLTEDLEKLHFSFHETVISGVAEQLPMWKRGVELCNGLMGMVVGKLYVEKHFSPKAKERMKQLVDNLTVAFGQRIDGLEWMGKATKLAAHDKLKQFTTKIGYPDKWKDYSSVTIKKDDLVGNVRRVVEFEYRYALKKLGGPVDRTEWYMSPQTINAYYNPLGNEIVFPAAILQPPFFNLEADDAVNYGSIGAVIGHEISHGFDDMGRRYDGKGNLRNWWTQDDLAEFEKRSSQLIKQYSSYKPFEDMAINGELTLGENIGDLGGLSVAYTAYKLSLNGKPSAEIDGFTGEQRFFLGWSQIWRRKYREQELKRRLLVDPHSPSRYRVIGIVSNMDAFYEAFSIKPEDKMFIAPENRVRIW